MSTILVVDDSPSNAHLLKAILETRGYKVVCAYTGKSGLDMAVEINPSLIITDLRLPGSSLDGWAVIEAVKNHPDLSHIPVIVISVEVTPDDRLRAYEAGCDNYLPKPFNINVLRRTVASYVEPP